MSTTTQPLSLRQARAYAGEIIAALQPYCLRVEIAGSIRRSRDWINDIEIVAIPKATIEPAPVDLFGNAIGEPKEVRDPGFMMVVDSLADVIVKGNPQTGRYIQFLTANGTKVDLFTATTKTWGYIQLIRTGSADFSKAVALRWSHLGYKGVDGALTRIGRLIDTPEEADVFRLLGMNVPPPHERELTAKGLSEWL